MDPFEVNIPLINPNEPHALLSVLNISDGQRVSQGDLLCTLETTKASMELLAEGEGFVTGLRASAGDVLQAGERLCWLAEDSAWRPPEESQMGLGEEGMLPQGLRITEPALALARQAELDLDSLPIGPLLTENAIREKIAGQPESLFEVPYSSFDSRAMVIYGGGGHGKSLIDLIRLLGDYDLVGVVDDGLAVDTQVMGLPVLGGGEQLASLAARGIRLAANAIGGIGDIQSRVRVFHRILTSDLVCPRLIHPSALVEASARLGEGVQVFPQAYVGSESQIDFGVIVNTSAVVSHDCLVGAYANIAPGALLAGGVKVGEGALIGMGVTVNLNVTIGAGARVGNSAVIKADVPPAGIVRAGTVWPPR